MHKIVLDGQTLRWYGAEPIIVSDSINQVRFEFIRLNGWENVVLTAQFTQSGTTYSVATQNDTVALPAGGSAGQVLAKTEEGTTWKDLPQGGVQSDWNQNDSAELDFIKNRPFYTETNETVFLPSGQYTIVTAQTRASGPAVEAIIATFTYYFHLLKL